MAMASDPLGFLLGDDPGGDQAVAERLVYVVTKDDIRFYGPAKYAIFIVG